MTRYTITKAVKYENKNGRPTMKRTVLCEIELIELGEIMSKPINKLQNKKIFIEK